MFDLSFKPAVASDIETLLVMMREFYAHEELRFDEAMARQALDGILSNAAFGRVFLIHASDQVAGYTVLTFGYSLEFHGRDAFVDELFLLEKFRGQGISQHALEFLAGVCRENGVAALHLEVERKNLAAQRAYRRFGFADHDRYLLTKWLDAE
ncbi:MAG: GNAT family N-acetyltransferase [Acidobacteriota bacterium]